MKNTESSGANGAIVEGKPRRGRRRPSGRAVLIESLRAALYDLPHNSGRTSRRYSLGRALVSMARRKSTVPDGLEGEVSAEIAERFGRKPTGFYVPLDAPVEQRIDTTVTGSGAAAVVFPPALFIDVLRAKLVLASLGAQITTFASERGSVRVPVQTTATPIAWVTEGSADAAFRALAMGSVTFVPHTVLINTGISRFLEELAAPGFDAWLYTELAAGITVGIDAAGIAGTSGANQPVGLLNTAGVPAVTLTADTGNGGAPAYADICAMEALAANNNADSRADARLGWLTSPNGRSKMRRVDGSTGSAGRWLWNQEVDQVFSYRAVATTNVPNNLTKGTGTNLSALVFGDWRNLGINLFSAVDVVFNPYTITTSGYYAIYAYQECDVQVFRTTGFVIASGMITT